MNVAKMRAVLAALDDKTELVFVLDADRDGYTFECRTFDAKKEPHDEGTFVFDADLETAEEDY